MGGGWVTAEKIQLKKLKGTRIEKPATRFLEGGFN
jgi:hypothetical protein